MPCNITYVLDGCNHRWRNLMLDTETKLSHGRRRIRPRQSCCALGKERLCRRGPGHKAGARIGKVNGGCGRVIEEWGGCGSVVDIVALQPLVEGSKAASENGLSIPEEIFGEPYAGLECIVFVCDETLWLSVSTGEVDAIQIEWRTVDRSKTGAGRIQLRCTRNISGRLTGEIQVGIEVREIIITLPGMRQSVVAKAQLDAQVLSDVPVVLRIKRCCLVDVVINGKASAWLNELVSPSTKSINGSPEYFVPL